MAERAATPDGGRTGAGAEPLALPAGTPAWITPELVRFTLRVWQPRYPAPLSADDAIAMILCVGHLSDLLTSSREL